MDARCLRTRPDAELVGASLRGDRGAFAVLVTRHWRTAATLAATMLGSEDLGRDAAQEATMAALQSLDKLRSPDRFGAWFCSITLNVARRWLRQTSAVHQARVLDVASAEPGPEELVELADLAAAVRSAVTQLADGQREAVMLFYLQGLTHREVAAELGISVDAVKARLHQARRALSPALAPLVTVSEEIPMTETDARQAWTDVFVAEVRRSADDNPALQAHVMVLAEQHGPRRLPIWVGPFEAIALALSLESEETPRPLTYQMAGRLLDASSSRVSEVRITRLTKEVFYAAIVIDGPSGRQEVDARPSDAVNLALIASAPIRVDSALLDHPGATGRSEWQDWSAGTAEVAREAVERQEEAMRHYRERLKPQDQQRSDP